MSTAWVVGACVSLWTVVVCVAAIWTMGPVRTRRVERERRREPW
jgi:hypothetical protein